MKILTIGDNCLDIYVDEGVGFPGGGCVNVAVYTSRLGADTSYIGAFGKDKASELIVEALVSEKVNVDNIQYFEGNTALAFIKHQDLDRIFIGSDRGVRYQLDPEENSLEFYDQFDLIHTTLDGQVDCFVKKWKQRGIITSYDYSHRATKEQLKLLKYVDFAFFSAGDEASKDELIKAAKKYTSMGASVVVITRGSKGSFVYDGNKIYLQKAIAVKPVDTLACGDVFIASFLNSQLNGMSIKTSLKIGATNASQALLTKGAFGREKDIEELDIRIEDYVMYSSPRK